MLVKKRNGDVVEFDEEKIKMAVGKAMTRTETEDDKLQDQVVRYVKKHLKDDEQGVVEVDSIHKLAEEALMNVKAFEVAREYITYRKEHMPDLFRPSENVKPYQYPELLEYMWAIYDSFWTHREFETQFKSDIQDMRVNLEHKEQEALRRCMLAISTVEVKSVKDFWGTVHNRMPKTEISMVGAAFANNEIIHLATYSHLLEIMGLNKDFENVKNVLALQKRLNYLSKSMAGRHGSNKEFLSTLILFSLFTEDVSLFSQFLIMMSVNKHKNYLKGIANAVQITAKEEAVHALFGVHLINITREEHPEMFDQEMEDFVNEMLQESYEAEKAIIDWIFEEGEWDYLTKHEIDEFIKDRYNQVMALCGFKKPFEVDEDLVAEKFEWFEVEAQTTNRIDFFNKKSTNYVRNNVSITADDLI